MRVCAALVLWLATSLGTARAQDGDGAYERWDAYVTVEATAGALAHARDGTWELGPLVELRTRILDAAGPFVAYQWDAAGESTLVAGIELRPLWPALFLLDASTGREWVDLFVQSLSVELGVALTPLGDPGLAFAWGLSIDVPLWLPSRAPGRGLGLRLQMRRIRVDENALEAPDADDVWSVGATLRMGFGAGSGRAGGGRWR
ncbi:MAG: hypothetical protein H6721_11900 [Sandaracinus sp.]|nr:hypothetical protein [Sandaracinus sp.]MCB9613034.1 hypothetical protein [Sandaracinus sp.]MCB9632826.1 hypothetical protein [Sandaracinus sp.]